MIIWCNIQTTWFKLLLNWNNSQTTEYMNKYIAVVIKCINFDLFVYPY